MGVNTLLDDTVSTTLLTLLYSAYKLLVFLFFIFLLIIFKFKYSYKIIIFLSKYIFKLK